MKRTLVFLSILSGILTAAGQDFTFADRVFGFLQAGRGDSIATLLAPQVRHLVPASTLSKGYAQIESSFGPMTEAGAWQRESQGALRTDRRRLLFGQTPLELCITTDDSLRIVGLNFRPVPTAPPAATPPTGVEERDITVGNGPVSLPGTLTLPARRTKPVPVVVLVHGSGPNDRDETLGPNKLFRTLADNLAKAGIATLRYDKRTYIYKERTEEVGGTLDYDTEVVDDALAALRLAAEQPETDAGRVFVLGHSLGGALMPRIARRSPVPLAGGIALAGPARPLEESLREQVAYLAALQGADSASAEADVRKLLSTLPESYLRATREYDGVAEARAAACPLLFVQGGHDYQVTATDFGLWKAGLGDRADVAFAWFPQCDHLMRELPAMAVPLDYSALRPLSPDVTACLVSFILGR